MKKQGVSKAFALNEKAAMNPLNAALFYRSRQYLQVET